MTSHLTCTRRLEFDAAHRVAGHENKCRFLHGHRYVVEATFEAPGLDPLGRVVDFGVIREKLGHWLDTHWDHTAILWEQDKELGQAVAEKTGQVVYYLPYNTTAENMAHYLLTGVCPELFAGEEIRCTVITLWETPNCQARAVI